VGDEVEVSRLLAGAPGDSRVPFGRLDLDAAVDLFHQGAVIDGLGEKVERADLHRPHGVLDLADRGHDEDHRFLEHLAVPFVEIETVAVGQSQVKQNEVRSVTLKVERSLGEILRRVDLVHLLLQPLLQGPAEELFVFNEEDQCHESVSPWFLPVR
jgi:hypothetical protein